MRSPCCLPFASGPEVPPVFSRRGIDLARMRDAMARGRFNERLTVWNFPLDVTTKTATVKHKVHSLGGRWVKWIAMRGIVTASNVRLQGDELSQLKLRVQLNGQDDLIMCEGQVGAVALGRQNTVSFASLFGTESGPALGFPRGDSNDCPPYVFASPPKLRTSDILTLTVTSVVNRGEGTPNLQAQLAATFIDADLYDELYLADTLGLGFNPYGPGGQP